MERGLLAEGGGSRAGQEAPGISEYRATYSVKAVKRVTATIRADK